MAEVFVHTGCISSDSQPKPQAPPVPVSYSSPLCLPDLDLSLTLTPEKLSTEPGILKRGRGSKPAQRQVRFDFGSKSRARGWKTHGASEDPVFSLGEPSCGSSETRTHKTVKHKYSKGKKRPEDSGLSVEKRAFGGQADVLIEEPSSVLSDGAKLNTTLALKAELKVLSEMAFDPRKAVQQQLRTSTHTKNNLTVRATEGVNIPRSQHLYGALISVNVSEDQLISQAIRDKLMLVPPTRTQANNKIRPADGPDFLAFYNPDELLRETPLLPGEDLKLPLPRPRPVPRPARTTFDLFHKHRQWET